MASVGGRHVGRPPDDVSRDHLQDIRRTVTRLREHTSVEPAEEMLEALASLSAAEEELRVASDELEAQERQIWELVQQNESEKEWWGRALTLLPVPVVLTTLQGVVVQVNPAVVLLLNRSHTSLIGKPLPIIVPLQQRRRVRNAMSAVTLDGGEISFQVDLMVSPSETVTTTALCSMQLFGGNHVLRWVFERQDAAMLLQPEQWDEPVAAMTELLALQTEAHDEAVRRVVEIANRLVPGAAASQVWAQAAGRLGDPISDGEVAVRLALLQEQAEQGPVLDAHEGQASIASADVGHDHRWPRLGALMAEQQIAAGVLAVPLGSEAASAGVLAVYSSPPARFPPQASDTIETLASTVSAILSAATEHASLVQLADQLEEALSSRAVIDQAKGLVMARHGCDSDEAFRRLAVASQRSNTKVRELARLLVDSVSAQDR